MNIRILETLYSKRNKVYKVIIESLPGKEIAMMSDYYKEDDNHYLIMKKYDATNTDILEREHDNIEMLDRLGINVPKILMKTKDALFLEYIHGELLTDLVEKRSFGYWIDGLALWMARLHRIAGKNGCLLKTDVNLRNFIFSEDAVYGLDFEELDYGDPRKDLANICFYILTNRPAFTREKHLIMRQFLKSYEDYSGKKLKDMGRFLRLSKEEAKIRRKKD